ncbi:DUF6768 family protein [Spongiimicrobium salis]|uniref:DUF6768 family protein n=1 Tax=Spongiimicrobium salis TaxID=1667022 RepID=UPI00374CA53C
MKKETEKIDELIKEALTKEEAAFYDQLEEENLFEKILRAHGGKTGWLVTVMTVMHMLILGLLIFCAIRFFDSADTREMLIWGAGAFCCIITACMLKLYIWMQMDKNALLRELKRVELQIAALSSKMES